MKRAYYLILGTLALLATSSVLCLQLIVIVNCRAVPLLPANATAASLQFLVLVLVWLFAVTTVFRDGRPSSIVYPNLKFALSLLACALAAAVSAAALVYLSSGSDAPLGQYRMQMLVATSIALAFATILQLTCIVRHFITSREPAVGRGTTPETPAVTPRRRLRRIKSIPYSRTKSCGDETMQEMASTTQPPSPIAMAPPTPCIFKHPFAPTVRPSSSKQKLMSTKKQQQQQQQQRRPSSADSGGQRSSVEASSFDSWDTSSVDMHNRQVVMDMSTSPSTQAHGLETIPDSPPRSRGSGARSPTDMGGLPRSLRTSRSLSHSRLKHREEGRTTPASSVHELHIHPLFRSDSQDPPPLASPGTSVLASPIAGKVITRRESSKSLGAMRNGSVVAAPQSPLAQQTCFESSDSLPREDRSASGGEDAASGSERKMTPPVPSWLLVREPHPNV
ncbi:hypothetical protein L249_2153 [Ophiocordyceps polyrhachis-furcata BCC 54312]|uniref:Uncharacterized protein n=1 Tax=Ophiocordyceps polyrhachis-furcata BCC 54312 TaxID=1330021 RepID=A0A367LPG4_9HYPO|nr:hypothetical protein L249_2153 [Ophiocordyceps polyrhachis-furcata BCC 54312]